MSPSHTSTQSTIDMGSCTLHVKSILHHERKEGNVLFNDALNTFYLRLYGDTHIKKDHSEGERGDTHCRHMGYSFRLAARVLLYASPQTG